MIFSNLRTPFQNQEPSAELQFYWHADRRKYSDQHIGEMPKWIKTKKELRNLVENN